jgi:dUTP pyrophosphatase
MQFKQLHSLAVLPSRGSKDCAGYDLYSVTKSVLNPGDRYLIPTGVAVNLPRGTAGLIWPRSKLAVKHGLDVLAGVVDEDYTGEIHVELINHGHVPIHINIGDKIAQMVVQRITQTEPYWIEELPKTTRGSSGITDSDLRMT